MRRDPAVTLLLVAHGTRDPAGPEVVERIAAAAGARLGVPTRVSYVDVIGPGVAEVLESTPGPVLALPAFLAAGYHVCCDLPEQIAATGRTDVAVCPPLGPAPELAEAMADRLRAAGRRPGDRVVFAAAGSSDERALEDVRDAAALLARRCGQPLAPSYVTTARPRTEDVCVGEPAFVAPYLLAPGLFHRRLAALPATVADPIGDHPAVVDLVVRRVRTALQRTAA